MRVVVCVKEVLDPDAVNNYVLAGNLQIADDGKTLEVSAIPRIMNGFDEQAIEAALRLRDAGVDCSITAVSIGQDLKGLLKHCAALGADEIVSIDANLNTVDHHVIANILSAYIKSSNGADIVLCGRQASDDDQGVVPALIAENLSMPAVTIAKAVEVSGDTVRITRATADGDQIVEGAAPVVITISNELGDPRFPSAKAKMAARKKKPQKISIDELNLSAEELTPKVTLNKQFVPEVQGNCEFIEGSAADAAKTLIDKLRADSII
jgi:electron transfer flavoprotein beta subunit